MQKQSAKHSTDYAFQLAYSLAKRGENAAQDIHWLDLSENFQLKTALETASKARSRITEEQDRIRELLLDAKNPTEIAAREYQIWYVEKYLNRAADIAEKRLAYFATINTPEDIEVELEKCANDKIHWFEYYAFGYDPRARTPLSVVPFALFPKQIELVDWLDFIVFKRRTSGLVEKSRDEGATELFVRWSIHNWRFTDSFSVLLSTRKEDEIDTKKKQGTLFERCRLQIRLLPTWMLPAKFDINKDLLPDKLIANFTNKNAILGEAPVERIGSGDRVTCALFDEHAFWRFGGYPQYRSMSQTTDSILSVSSVGGKLNQYADLAFDGVTAKFVLDWRDNPFKTKAWYDSLPFGYIAPKMSKTTIAQEVDRNYDAAQPGKVWKIREEYNFITMSEFLRPFEAAGLKYKFFDNQGRFKIPDDWRFLETSDYGQSQGHDWSYFLAAQPRASYPLSDSHFVFIGQNLEPTGLTTEEAVKQWRGFKEKLNVLSRQPFGRYNSHEQLDLRKVLLEKYGELWLAWKTNYTAGIEQIQDWFTLVDKEKPNPFRSQLSGRCQLLFVAPDAEYEIAYNERLAQWFVTMSATEQGFLTLRKQLSAYHYAESELGKAVKAMRPVKEFDDIVDALRGYAVMWNQTPDPLTARENIQKRLGEVSPTLTNEFIAREYNGVITPGKQMALLEATIKVKKELDITDEDLDDSEFVYEDDFGFGGY